MKRKEFNELDIFDENFKRQLNDLLNEDLWRDSFRDKFVDLFVAFFFRNCDCYSDRTRDKIFKYMCDILHEKLYPNETTGAIVNLGPEGLKLIKYALSKPSFR